jgi:S-DNA-T family DNA segregation ATPase FtsK/SpoIIIE
VTAFFPDVFMKTSPLNYSLRLANTELGSAADRYDLPDMLTFLEMFGVGKVEHLNALTRWRESDPVKTLEAPVGVDGLGGLFKLDLHEKYHGPHGLVAGMTGSGKSEFIIAYILSLAVCYHPHEVAFILIDYKGGGMAKSFEKLPHTAGIITNLDGAAIKRSLVSIESELKRRQAIFAAAGQSTGMSNIDIYRYQRIYREGKVTEPLQHLFIISDEFAELKTQQPEFMAQLVSTARIGRSLGVHLILATQKPSGVVDDQIWSNSKFRVCLKVQERADSMDMLKRPDAAELTKTGRFYLQVGYNEFFEMGQSAWAGAPYYPAERVQSVKDHSVVVIDRNGRTLREAQLEKKKIQNPPKQLDMITAYLKETADREGICVRPLWLPPLPELLLFDDLRQRYNTVEKPFVLEPVVGEYDDPVKQSQDLLRLPLEGNVILYGATGSGKTTFLFTMIYALITGHAPTEVQLYLLDFAAETLRAFARAPHVGDVALLQETEKVGNLFKLLKKELDQRKKNMSNYGGDWRMMPENMRPPALVVIINNISAFSEAYEDKEDALAYFAREGGKYGIFFMLTASGTSAVRFRMLQNFRHVLTLQLNDENDYSVVVGKTDGLTPSRSPGRGLVKLEGVHEFQTAALTPDEGSFAFVQARCEALRETWQGAAASKIPILPDTVDHEFLWEHYTGEGLPIGVETSSLKVYLYPFQSTYLTPVLSVGEESQRFLRDVATLLALGGKELIYLEADPPAQYADFPLNTCLNAAMCEESVNKLYDLVLYRNNTYKESLENGVDCEEFPEQWVLLSGLNSIRNMLTDDGREKLALFLGKGDQRFHITVIIAEQPHTIAGFALEKWYKDRITGVDGVWVGGGITEQYNLKPAKITADMRAEQTGQFGYALSRGKAVRLKLLSEEWEEV